MANTIASELQLTRVLSGAMTAFKRAILPLTSFSTVFKNEPLQGTDTIAVPYYPLSTSASQTRATDGSYKALATATATQSKLIVPTKNKLQAISFTAAERNRQPAFDPNKHGMLKGEKLAYDVIAEILSGVRSADYTGTTLPVGVASNFDEEDVALLAQYCMDDYWPEIDRSLILTPAFYFNLLKQPAILDGSQSGNFQAIRDAIVKRVLSFDIYGTAGMVSNNGTAIACTGANSGDLFTATAHGFAVGDRIRFPNVEGGTGITEDTGRYYVLTVPSADTFTIAATPGGAQVTISADATVGTTVQKYENLGGMAVHSSAFGVAFAPVPPSGAMQNQLADYRIVEDPESELVLEYKHLVYPDTNEEVQVIECNYGWEQFETAALKPLLIS